MKTVNLTHCTYPIVETFHSIQGEGAWTGVSAFLFALEGVMFIVLGAIKRNLGTLNVIPISQWKIYSSQLKWLIRL